MCLYHCVKDTKRNNLSHNICTKFATFFCFWLILHAKTFQQAATTGLLGSRPIAIFAKKIQTTRNLLFLSIILFNTRSIYSKNLVISNRGFQRNRRYSITVAKGTKKTVHRISILTLPRVSKVPYHRKWVSYDIIVPKITKIVILVCFIILYLVSRCMVS